MDEGVMMLLALCLILFVFILPKKGAPGPSQVFSPFNNDGGSAWQTTGGGNGSGGQTEGVEYSRDISLGSGNASSEIQSYLEYITLNNQSEGPIDITGWVLKNSKDERGYQIGSNIQNFPADTAVIPKGTSFLSPTNSNTLKDIILKSGERAIITTGSIGVADPVKIVSFKENKCSGYLESTSNYTFTPNLSRNCPLPKEEPGFSSLDRGCQDFLNNFSSCHIPKYGGLDSSGYRCNDCVDGKVNLTDACISFIKSHFDYGSCAYNHKDDPDFESDTWRIFLGRGWEMWNRDHETISLFDNLKREVNSLSY
jgi:hypothetical protein